MNAGPSILKQLALVGTILGAGGLGYFFAISRMPAPAPEPEPAAVADIAVQATPDEIKIDDSFLAVVGIKTEAVATGNLNAEILAPASVTIALNGEASVTAHAAGTITRLFKRPGDTVTAGETLALVESRDAATMAADKSVAESKVSLARMALTREQALYDQGVTPRQDLERVQAELAVALAEAARARDLAIAARVTPDGNIAVTSPMAGRITLAGAPLGTFVQQETELFRITDARFIQIEASVTAADAARISVGDVASVETPTGGILAATVRSISPLVNAETRAANILLAPSDNRGLLSPGAAVRVSITPKNSAPAGLVIPEDAIQNVDGRNVVFVRTAAGFKIQPIVIGSRSAGRVSIQSGLNGSETIATANAFFLKAEFAKGAGE